MLDRGSGGERYGRFKLKQGVASVTTRARAYFGKICRHNQIITSHVSILISGDERVVVKA
jgi:hypothetical protein